MGRKRIGILLAQAEEKNQSAFLEGFLKEAFILDFDVCVFSMHVRLQGTEAREVGDSNIYNLFRPELFDAVVMMPDTIQTPGVADRLNQMLKDEFKGPVLSVDKENEYFPCVMMDHYTPVLNLINHLIEVHNYRDIVFVSGFKGHEHSIQREKAYRDSLKLHGIEPDEKNIYNGNYWYDSGKDIAVKIIEERECLPQAIACGNDYMAIGVAAELERRGYKVPQDIAIIGYDSVEEGRKGPVSLTSADIPATSCGNYCAHWIDEALKGGSLGEFVAEAPLRIGGSCGCQVEEDMFYLGRRRTWDTDVAAAGYNSYYNYIMESLLSQTDNRGFYNAVFQYTGQLRDFDSFDLCINDYYKNEDLLSDRTEFGRNYTDRMCRVIKCGPDREVGNFINFEDEFNRKDLIPELDEERDYPTAFFFNPLHFDDKCYGYAVISYGSVPKSYDTTYRNWLKDIMQGMEAFYRQSALKSILNKLESAQIRDGLTGLYNYKGFLKRSDSLYHRAMSENSNVLVMIIDLIGLKDINAQFGRDMGDDALISLAKIISDAAMNTEICSRISNSEFAIASVSEDSQERSKELSDRINERVAAFNGENEEDYNYRLSVYIGSKAAVVTEHEGMEILVNTAIAAKNNIKNSKSRNKSAKLSKEERIHNTESDKLVTDILDNNRFKYFFQPIVSARTGKIFAYEALMRSDTVKNVAPLDILESAGRMNRLYDVERATFFNVLDYVDAHRNMLAGKKVFINSIPGYQLEAADKDIVIERMKLHKGELVVEFTEETEIDDVSLTEMKNHYTRINVETAIDDYGSGYSNVNNLLRYMPKYVKIDRNLIMDIHKDPQKQHFVRDIIEFAHDNDILTLAEGVELPEEMREVIRLGIDLIQGYYTCRPQSEMIPVIDRGVINEIVQYNQAVSSKYNKRLYRMTLDKVSMVQLALDQYTAISITKHEPGSAVELTGVPGFQSNATVRVEDDFVGTIVLNSVSLSGDRGFPCLDIGDNCVVNLLLVGDNEMLTGGIRVPESSSITFIGRGNLNMVINSGRYYAIGNDLESKNGDITFDQDGGIIIDANGMSGVGIGSGLGGNITIKKGHYELDMKGQDGVCIGSVSGNVSMNIDMCDMDIYSGMANGAIIGSRDGDASIRMENVSARIVGSGSNVIGIGTSEGAHCSARVKNANITMDIRASECYGLGSRNAETDITVEHASLRVYAQGKAAYALGNALGNAKIHFANSDISTDVYNNTGTDIGTRDEYITIENGRMEFLANGKTIERHIIETAL